MSGVTSWSALAAAEMDRKVVRQFVQQQSPVKVVLLFPSTDAIIIWTGTVDNSLKFRGTTPVKEVLENLMQQWGNGKIIDNEGFEVTPSSPHLQPGCYEYKGILSGGMLYPSALAQNMSACPPNTGQARDAELYYEAKSECIRKWQQLWSLPLSQSRKVK